MTETTQPETPQSEATPAEATPAPAAPAAAASEIPAPPEDPSIVGELSEEEQVIFTTYKRNQNTGNQELGQLAYRSFQVARAMEDQTAKFQEFSKALVESKNLNEEGMQYQLLGNGKIRGIKDPQAAAAAQAAAQASPAPPAPPAPISEADAKVAQLEAALAKVKAEARAKANGAATEAKV